MWVFPCTGRETGGGPPYYLKDVARIAESELSDGGVRAKNRSLVAGSGRWLSGVGSVALGARARANLPSRF